MLVNNLILVISDILKILWNSPKPTDKLLSEIFRTKKNIGSKERRFASEIIFAILRNKLILEYLIKKLEDIDLISSNDNKYLLSIYLFLILKDSNQDISPEFEPQILLSRINQNAKISNILESYFNDKLNNITFNVIDAFEELNKVISNLQEGNDKDNLKALSIRYSFPEWLLERIVHKFNNKEQLINFLYKSTNSAHPTIRVNLLNSSIEEIENELRNSNIKFYHSQLSPSAIVLQDRVQLSELDFFKLGKVEVQDEGSQIISYILDPQPGESVLDACAGAGGKSLHIAELMKNQGRVIANDIEFHRLKEIPKRAARSGLSIIDTFNSRDNDLREFTDKDRTLRDGFDRILIDAPCSGLGTIRRDPMKKYRINPNLIEKLQRNQLQILTEYSKFLRVGGILVYSTCSLLPDENEWVIEAFLQQNENIAGDPILSIINKNKIGLENISNDAFVLHIDFTQSNSDGFFMARMKRIE